jgi:hypothetical protein
MAPTTVSGRIKKWISEALVEKPVKKRTAAHGPAFFIEDIETPVAAWMKCVKDYLKITFPASPI